MSDDENNANKRNKKAFLGNPESTMATGSAGLKESIGVTPVFGNVTNVTAAGDVTRISFGENYGGVGPKYHTSVVLPTQAALELATLIQQVVGAHQKRIEQESKTITPAKGTLN